MRMDIEGSDKIDGTSDTEDAEGAVSADGFTDLELWFVAGLPGGESTFITSVTFYGSSMYLKCLAFTVSKIH